MNDGVRADPLEELGRAMHTLARTKIPPEVRIGGKQVMALLVQDAGITNTGPLSGAILLGSPVLVDPMLPENMVTIGDRALIYVGGQWYAFDLALLQPRSSFSPVDPEEISRMWAGLR